ncbi:hypothetical protein MKW92_031895, partial [Papaver armeniacum]
LLCLLLVSKRESSIFVKMFSLMTLIYSNLNGLSPLCHTYAGNFTGARIFLSGSSLRTEGTVCNLVNFLSDELLLPEN